MEHTVISETEHESICTCGYTAHGTNLEHTRNNMEYHLDHV